MSFSEQLIYAMVKPGNYKELLELKKSRAVIFVLVISLMLGVIGYAVPTAAVISGFGGFHNLFERSMGNMQVVEGQMSIAEPFFMNVSGLKIIINSEKERVADERMTTEGAYIAVGKSVIRLAITGNGKATDYATYKVSDFFPDGFSNQTLVGMIPRIYFLLTLVFLAYCVGFFIKYAVLALIFSITIQAVNKRAEMGLSYGQIFMICFYGQTLGILISNFNSALNLLPQMLVSLVCIFISIHMITSATMAIKGPGAPGRL